MRIDDDILFIGVSSDCTVAAVLVAGHQHVMVTYNRRLVHGATLGLVELWARRTFATGWLLGTLSAADLGMLT